MLNVNKAYVNVNVNVNVNIIKAYPIIRMKD